MCLRHYASEARSQKLVISHIFGPFVSVDHKLSFNVGSFRGPISLVEYSAKLSLADYLTQFLSLSGIWVELSVASLISRRKRFDTIHIYGTWTALEAKLRAYSSSNSAPCTESEPLQSPTSRAGGAGEQRRLVSTAFKLATLLVFAGQAVNLCVICAEYGTILTYAQMLNPEFAYRLPSTVIRLDINDLYSPRAQTSITEENYEEVLMRNNSWFDLTLGEIFKETMGEEVLSKCRVKSYEWWDFVKGEFDREKSV